MKELQDFGGGNGIAAQVLLLGEGYRLSILLQHDSHGDFAGSLVSLA